MNPFVRVLDAIAKTIDDVRAFARREPVLTRWAIGALVTIAAKYGLDLDAEVVWSYLAVGTPAAVLARRKVKPV